MKGFLEVFTLFNPGIQTMGGKPSWGFRDLEFGTEVSPWGGGHNFLTKSPLGEFRESPGVLGVLRGQLWLDGGPIGGGATPW